MDLSLSGLRGTKFMSVYNFSAQWRPSFGNQRMLNFAVVAVLDKRLRSRLSKKFNIHLSRNFSHFRNLGIRESAHVIFFLVRVRYSVD